MVKIDPICCSTVRWSPRDAVELLDRLTPLFVTTFYAGVNGWNGKLPSHEWFLEKNIRNA